MKELLRADITKAITYLNQAIACENRTEALGYIYRALGRLQSAASSADLEAEQAERLELRR